MATNPFKDQFDPTKVLNQTQTAEVDQSFSPILQYATDDKETFDEVKPTDFQPADWDPATMDVKPEGLVERRLTGLLDKESDYMKQARTAGLQTAAQRGLLNTSMAAEAGESARIRAGLPIAQQDAEAYNRQQLQNQQYMNQARQYNADTWNKAELANLDANMREQLARFDHTRATALQDLKSKYSILENRDTAMSEMYKQYLANVGTILNNPDLSGDRRAEALDKLSAGIDSVMNFYSSAVGTTATTATGGTWGEQVAADNTQVEAAKAAERAATFNGADPFSYNAVDEMPWTMQQEWSRMYGESLTGQPVQPPQVRDMKDRSYTIQQRFKDYISKDGRGVRALDGTMLKDIGAMRGYNNELIKSMKESGLIKNYGNYNGVLYPVTGDDRKDRSYRAELYSGGIQQYGDEGGWLGKTRPLGDMTIRWFQ